MKPNNVSKNLIPVHFESFFWGLSLANFGPVVAYEGRFENQKCKKIETCLKLRVTWVRPKHTQFPKLISHLATLAQHLHPICLDALIL